MKGLYYAKEIINLIENNKVEEISEVLEKFEVNCYIRQYSTARAMNLSASDYLPTTFTEVKENIKLFKDNINEYINANKDFSVGKKSILGLIINGLFPHRVQESYYWL